MIRFLTSDFHRRPEEGRLFFAAIAAGLLRLGVSVRGAEFAPRRRRKTKPCNTLHPMGYRLRHQACLACHALLWLGPARKLDHKIHAIRACEFKSPGRLRPKKSPRQLKQFLIVGTVRPFRFCAETHNMCLILQFQNTTGFGKIEQFIMYRQLPKFASEAFLVFNLSLGGRSGRS